jgi:hypothetical protein
MAGDKIRARVGRADVLVLLGLLLVGAAMWFAVGWVGVLFLTGLLLVAVGVGEARINGEMDNAERGRRL